MSEVSVQRKNEAPVATTAGRGELDPFRLIRNLFRWDPFQEMKPLWSVDSTGFTPALDVKETKDSFVCGLGCRGKRRGNPLVTIDALYVLREAKRERW
jgi:hypothetical protein